MPCYGLFDERKTEESELEEEIDWGKESLKLIEKLNSAKTVKKLQKKQKSLAKKEKRLKKKMRSAVASNKSRSTLKIVQWKWMDDNGQFHAYPENVTEALEKNKRV